MPEPRKHTTKGRQGRRRSHLALKPKKLISCSHCKRRILSHKMCAACGYYKGKEVVNVLAKELKKKERQKKQQQK
jgi:large subunit ribosomal protein L32